MNLSRAAKKFRAERPPESKSPKPVNEQKQKPSHAPPPAPEPVVEVPAPVEVVAEEVAALAVEPVPEPLAVIEPPEPAAPAPKKTWPAKAKRPQFVREQVERRERPPAPALPARSTKLVARMLTQNLALVPKEDAPKLPR